MAQGSRTSEGLTEFTSSESRLDRLVSLVAMASGDPVTIMAVEAKAGRDLNLKNREVVGRHIRLAEALGLLMRAGDRLKTTEAASAVFQLERVRGLEPGGLSQYSRAYLTQALFEVAPFQLARLLLTIDRHQRVPWSTIVISYFRQDGGLPWNRATVEKSLAEFDRTGKTPRLLEHKVACSVGWLRGIGLVSAAGPYSLTPGGSRVLGIWDDSRGEFTRGPVTLSGLAAGVESPVGAKRARTATRVLAVLTDSIQGFPSAHGLVGYEQLRVFITLSLLIDEGIAVEEVDFYEVVKSAWRAGVVRSIIVGRDGQPSAVTLPES
jgi:hypothetical protein